MKKTKLDLLYSVWESADTMDLTGRAEAMLELEIAHDTDIMAEAQRAFIHPLSVVRREIVKLTGIEMDEHPNVIKSAMIQRNIMGCRLH